MSSVTRDRASATFPAVRTLALSALSVVAACGIGFDPVAPPPVPPVDMPDAAIDAPPDVPQPPDAPPTVLACAPQTFSVAGTPKFITAVGTRRGYDVFVVDTGGSVTGYAYRFTPDNKLELVPDTGKALPVPLTPNHPVGALALDSDASDGVEVAIAVTYDIPAVTNTATGVVVIPLNAQLERADVTEPATMNDGVEGGPGILALGDQGKVAFVARVNDGTLGLAQVSRRGVLVPGSGKVIDTAGHTVTGPTLVRSATGYLAVWGDSSGTAPDAVATSLLDENFVGQPPVTIYADPNHGSFNPTAAYSAALDRYLFAWWEKPGRDFVKFSMRDRLLAPMPGLIDLGIEGAVPVVAVGDRDFLVVWEDPTTAPKRVSAARVAPDGSVTRPGVTNIGGANVDFDLVVHNGQPALFWIEKPTGAAALLRVDALCAM